jgi:hypothetical protein
MRRGQPSETTRVADIFISQKYGVEAAAK